MDIFANNLKSMDEWQVSKTHTRQFPPINTNYSDLPKYNP